MATEIPRPPDDKPQAMDLSSIGEALGLANGKEKAMYLWIGYWIFCAGVGALKGLFG